MQLFFDVSHGAHSNDFLLADFPMDFYVEISQEDHTEDTLSNINLCDDDSLGLVW